MASQLPKTILLSRIDNLGDVVLTLPMAKVIKQHWPECQVIFLCRPYAVDVVAACPDVDQVITWQVDQTDQQVMRVLAEVQIDTIIHVFPNKQLARCAKRVGIQQRIGTSHRLYHWWTCNIRPSFSRAKSDLHEAQLNLQLLSAIGIDADLSVDTLSQSIYLQPSLSQQQTVQPWLDPNRFSLVLHPLSNANGREWPLENYVALCHKLDSERYQILLNGVEAERDRLAPLIQLIPDNQQLFSLSLADKVALFAQCDGMVVGSTGPLHIAAAVGMPVLGLFPPKHTMNPKRWQPIGPKARYLVDNVDCQQICSNTDCACMEALTVDQVVEVICEWYNAASFEIGAIK